MLAALDGARNDGAETVSRVARVAKEGQVSSQDLRGAGVVAEVRYDTKLGVKTLRIRSTAGVRNSMSLPLIVQFEWPAVDGASREAASEHLSREADRAGATLDSAEAMDPGRPSNAHAEQRVLRRLVAPGRTVFAPLAASVGGSVRVAPFIAAFRPG